MSNNWNGMGLPPVGTKCIAITDWCHNKHVKSFHGKEVDIVLHDMGMAVFRKEREDGSYSYHALVNDEDNHFKPIESGE